MAEESDGLPEPIAREKWDFSEFKEPELQGIYYYEYCRSCPAIVAAVEAYRKAIGFSVEEIREKIRYLKTGIPEAEKFILEKIKEGKEGHDEKWGEIMRNSQPFLFSWKAFEETRKSREARKRPKNPEPETVLYSMLFTFLPDEPFIELINNWVKQHEFPDFPAKYNSHFMIGEGKNIISDLRGEPPFMVKESIKKLKSQSVSKALSRTFDLVLDPEHLGEVKALDKKGPIENLWNEDDDFIEIPTVHPSVEDQVYVADWTKKNSVLRKEFEQFLKKRPDKYKDKRNIDFVGVGGTTLKHTHSKALQYLGVWRRKQTCSWTQFYALKDHNDKKNRYDDLGVGKKENVIRLAKVHYNIAQEILDEFEDTIFDYLEKSWVIFKEKAGGGDNSP